MHIKSMIERMIELREEQNLALCLLAVCPNSDAVLEAAVKAAGRNHTPMLFAATLNQVDLDGGYTGWKPADFVARLDAYAQKYEVDRTNLMPCLDHGGPWLKDIHTLNRLSYEQTLAAVKESITAMLEAGYNLLHIDPTVDRTLKGPIPVELVVERSLDLIAHAESERQRLNLPPVSYEVGTEEVHGGLVDLSSFKRFLKLLYAGLEARGLQQAAPAFVVAQVGTDLHTTSFDREAAERLYEIVAPYGALVKGHYTDWVENPAEYSVAGMGGANVGPEFTAEEFDALRTLDAREKDLLRIKPDLKPARFFEVLTEAVDRSNRWKKWLQPDEPGKALTELTPERQEWMLKTSARYVWASEEVVAARRHLYANLRAVMPDPHQIVVERIVSAIERYIVAFHLFGSADLFAQSAETRGLRGEGMPD